MRVKPHHENVRLAPIEESSIVSVFSDSGRARAQTSGPEVTQVGGRS